MESTVHKSGMILKIINKMKMAGFDSAKNLTTMINFSENRHLAQKLQNVYTKRFVVAGKKKLRN